MQAGLGQRTVFFNRKINKQAKNRGRLPLGADVALSGGVLQAVWFLMDLRERCSNPAGFVVLSTNVLEKYEMPETSKMPPIAVNDQ